MTNGIDGKEKVSSSRTSSTTTNTTTIATKETKNTTPKNGTPKPAKTIRGTSNQAATTTGRLYFGSSPSSLSEKEEISCLTKEEECMLKTALAMIILRKKTTRKRNIQDQEQNENDVGNDIGRRMNKKGKDGSTVMMTTSTTTTTTTANTCTAHGNNKNNRNSHMSILDSMFVLPSSTGSTGMNDSNKKINNSRSAFKQQQQQHWTLLQNFHSKHLDQMFRIACTMVITATTTTTTATSSSHQSQTGPTIINTNGISNNINNNKDNHYDLLTGTASHLVQQLQAWIIQLEKEQKIKMTSTKNNGGNGNDVCDNRNDYHSHHHHCHCHHHHHDYDQNGNDKLVPPQPVQEWIRICLLARDPAVSFPVFDAIVMAATGSTRSNTSNHRYMTKQRLLETILWVVSTLLYDIYHDQIELPSSSSSSTIRNVTGKSSHSRTTTTAGRTTLDLLAVHSLQLFQSCIMALCSSNANRNHNHHGSTNDLYHRRHHQRPYHHSIVDDTTTANSSYGTDRYCYVSNNHGNTRRMKARINNGTRTSSVAAMKVEEDSHESDHLLPNAQIQHPPFDGHDNENNHHDHHHDHYHGGGGEEIDYETKPSSLPSYVYPRRPHHVRDHRDNHTDKEIETATRRRMVETNTRPFQQGGAYHNYEQQQIHWQQQQQQHDHDVVDNNTDDRIWMILQMTLGEELLIPLSSMEIVKIHMKLSMKTTTSMSTINSNNGRRRNRNKMNIPSSSYHRFVRMTDSSSSFSPSTIAPGTTKTKPFQEKQHPDEKKGKGSNGDDEKNHVLDDKIDQNQHQNEGEDEGKNEKHDTKSKQQQQQQRSMVFGGGGGGGGRGTTTMNSTLYCLDPGAKLLLRIVIYRMILQYQ